MKITGAAAAQKPERERRWRNESTTPMENAFASQLEQRLPPPPEQAASSSASDVVSTAGSPSDASAERLTVDDLPPRMTLSPAANDDGGALALPEGMTLHAGAQAEEPIAAQGPPAPTKPEPEDGAKDAKLAPDTFGANTNLSAAGGLVGVPGPNANAGNGADDVAGGLGLGV